MNLQSLPLFAALTNRMKWLGARQGVLAQNVANSDTPGYRPQDLKPLGFKELLRHGQGGPGSPGRLAPATPQPTHISSSTAAPGRNFPGAGRDTAYEVTPSGNGVTIEEQMMKVAETRMDFELTSSLYRKHVDMFRIVLGRK